MFSRAEIKNEIAASKYDEIMVSLTFPVTSVYHHFIIKPKYSVYTTR